MQSHAFIQSAQAKKSGVNWADLQIYLFLMGVGENTHMDVHKFCNINPGILKGYLSTFKGKDAFAIVVNLGLVETTGEITLKDKNPLSHPILSPNYFGNPKDLKVLLEG